VFAILSIWSKMVKNIFPIIQMNGLVFSNKVKSNKDRCSNVNTVSKCFFLRNQTKTRYYFRPSIFIQMKCLQLKTKYFA
jgi:hypothetical protein